MLAGRCHICKTMGIDFLHGGETVEFLQGRNFKPNFVTDNECKGLCIATNSVFKLLTENLFYSMTLDWKPLGKGPKLQASAGVEKTCWKWSAHCIVCLSQVMLVDCLMCKCTERGFKVRIMSLLLWPWVKIGSPLRAGPFFPVYVQSNFSAHARFCSVDKYKMCGVFWKRLRKNISNHIFVHVCIAVVVVRWNFLSYIEHRPLCNYLMPEGKTFNLFIVL